MSYFDMEFQSNIERKKKRLWFNHGTSETLNDPVERF